MKYTIKVNEVKKQDSNVKEFATVVFGNSFKITNIAIVQNKENGKLFVSMPRYKSNEKDENGRDIYQDICYPVTKNFRAKLYGEIEKAYEEAKEKQRQETDGIQQKTAVVNDADKNKISGAETLSFR